MTAKTQLQAHEDVCEIRYKGIEDGQKMLIDEVRGMRQEMSLLKQEMSMGRGAVKAVAWIGGIIALVLAVLKLGGKI